MFTKGLRVISPTRRVISLASKVPQPIPAAALCISLSMNLSLLAHDDNVPKVSQMFPSHVFNVPPHKFMKS